jgi:hypothetical protein
MLLTVGDVARRLNCSTWLVRIMVDKGRLKAAAYKPLRIDAGEFERSLVSWVIPAAEARYVKAANDDLEGLVSFARFWIGRVRRVAQAPMTW